MNKSIIDNLSGEGTGIDRRTLLCQAIATLSATLAGCGGGGGSGISTTAASAVAATTGATSGVTQGAVADTVASTVSTVTTTSTPVEPACVDPAENAQPEAAARTAFIHPGLLNTEAGYDRIRARVAAGDQPWKDAWTSLLADPWSYSRATPRPIVDVTRPGNVRQMYIDMQRTYELALIWKITGNTEYANTAVVFLDTWSSNMKTLTGNADAYLAAGLYGYQWACAAEIMRTYPGWSAEGIARWQKLLTDVFYRLSNEFLVSHHGTENNITNYWANWDLISIVGIMAIGVFCDNVAMYEQGKAYFFNGRGNGAAAHMVYLIHPGLLGQYQESGRDQGHATLGIACLAAICEIAWNQGDDIYAYWNNRVLSAVEYVAASNLVNADGTDRDLPFDRYANKQGVFTQIAGTGRASRRPGFEAFYNHYVNRRGMSAPYTTLMAAAIRPEWRDATGDGPGLGTVTYSLAPIAKGAAPSGVVVRVAGNAVVLDWWGTAYATGYRVERSPTACGPFVFLASVDERRTYTDSPPAGTWYYRVTSVASTGNLSSQPVKLVFPGELWFHLPLNEGQGTQAADATGRFGVSSLTGGVAWAAGRGTASAAVLDGKSGYIVLPVGVMAALADFTLSLWVRLTDASLRGAWLLNISTSDVAYMSIVPRDGAWKLRTLTTLTTNYGEQETYSPDALPANKWLHIALTLSGKTQTLYVNGVAVGSNTAVDVAPHQMGKTAQNWIGRSSYGADPYFTGRVQDLRIHSRALSAQELVSLANA